MRRDDRFVLTRVKGSPLRHPLVLFAGGAVLLAVLGVNVFGDGLRDALDPRSKARID
jgi:ABC-type dipeptide/oligopeptide/nickel transport system permease subunit